MHRRKRHPLGFLRCVASDNRSRLLPSSPRSDPPEGLALPAIFDASGSFLVLV